MPQRLRTVIFPVAGLGTRFLPATKVVPKEMLPVMDRPLIQWATDEAVAAGADTLVVGSALWEGGDVTDMIAKFKAL